MITSDKNTPRRYRHENVLVKIDHFYQIKIGSIWVFSRSKGTAVKRKFRFEMNKHHLRGKTLSWSNMNQQFARFTNHLRWPHLKQLKIKWCGHIIL